MSSGFFDASLSSIAEQQALVASLVPGSESHRVATGVLLLLQDGLFVLTETRAMLDRTTRHR